MMWRFTADRVGLQDHSRVETVQSTLLAALKTHCSGRYGRSGGVMVGRLLGKLAELRSVGRLAGDVLVWRLQTASEPTELDALSRVLSVVSDHPYSHVSM